MRSLLQRPEFREFVFAFCSLIALFTGAALFPDDRIPKKPALDVAGGNPPDDGNYQMVAYKPAGNDVIDLGMNKGAIGSGTATLLGESYSVSGEVVDRYTWVLCLRGIDGKVVCILEGRFNGREFSGSRRWFNGHAADHFLYVLVERPPVNS